MSPLFRAAAVPFLVPAVAAAALLAFATALHGSFVNWDDRWLVIDNVAIRSLASVPHLFDPTADRGPLGAEYLPIRDLSYVADHAFFGVEPRGYRLGNVLLHALSAAAAFVFLLEGLRSRAAAFAGAVLWAVHPLHAEVVAWVSARKDVLNAAFAFTAAALYLRAARTGSRGAWWGALASFAAATLSKTTAAAMPAALFAWEVLVADPAVPVGRRAIRAAARVAPFLAIAAAGAWINSVHQAGTWKAPTWHGGGPLENVFVVAGVHLDYLCRSVAPLGLAPVYRSGTSDPASAWNIAGLVLGLIAVVAIPVAAGRAPRAAAAGAWWFLLLFPASSLVVPLLNLSADRYVHLPLLGPAALAGIGWAAASRRAPRAAAVALGVAVVALAAGAALQARHWRDSLSLWTRAVEASPDAGKAWQNRAAALVAAGRRREAVESFRRMIDVEPWDAAWWTLAGVRFHDLGGQDLQPEVEDVLRHAAARAGPRRAGPFLALHAYLDRCGRRAESRAALEEAARREPDHGEVLVGLGVAALGDGNRTAARGLLERALARRLPPGEERRAREALLSIHEQTGDADGAALQRAGLRRLAERRGEGGER